MSTIPSETTIEYSHDDNVINVVGAHGINFSSDNSSKLDYDVNDIYLPQLGYDAHNLTGEGNYIEIMKNNGAYPEVITDRLEA